MQVPLDKVLVMVCNLVNLYLLSSHGSAEDIDEGLRSC